jgi:predicted GH43/DUF377 family glycosyl hydrolase
MTEFVRRAPLRLRPDPSRVVTRLFVAGEEMPAGDSRALAVVERILALSDEEVSATLATTVAQFAPRHRAIEETWGRYCDLMTQRLPGDVQVSPERRLLIGAYFTHEVSVEAASLCNPSMVPHPDQEGLGAGELRFIMSLRAVSEGHLSAIEFRTGIVTLDGDVRIDDPGPFLAGAESHLGRYNRELFHAKLAEEGMDNEYAALVLDGLESTFGPADLDDAIGGIHRQLRAREIVWETVERLRWLAANNYSVSFPVKSKVAERLLWPHGPAERNGMEDARFVRFVDAGGKATFLATYTAFDGAHVAPHLISTTDFRTFHVSQLAGPAAHNKGLALFPRLVGGHYMALSRWDREHSSVASSVDGNIWGEATTLDLVPEPWELIQVGNCGSPIETPEGWVVLTHGVGAMRVYCIGAVLLDLEDPTRVVGRTPEPILCPDETEREGYVPNVVYSCGGLAHGDVLVVPYGVSDSAVGVAVVDLPELVERMRKAGP